MQTPRTEELTATARGCRVAYLFVLGAELNSSQWAAQLGCTRRNAYRILEKASLVMPVYRDDDGVWRLLDKEPGQRDRLALP